MKVIDLIILGGSVKGKVICVEISFVCLILRDFDEK